MASGAHDVVVRRLGAADLERYVALRLEMLAESPWAFGSSPGQDRGSDPEHMRRVLSGGPTLEHAVIGAAEGDGRLVSVAGVMRETALKRRHIASIFGVYTTPSARGRGLGRQVVATALHLARSWAGVEWAQLSVSERGAAAQRLYASLGFVAWGTEPDALRVDGVGYAETHMCVRL